MKTRMLIPSALVITILTFALGFGGNTTLEKRTGTSRLNRGRLMTTYGYRDGDVLVQHLKNPLGELICAVTQSRYSHCGMVVHLNGAPHVLEAIGPVKHTPLKQWISQGYGGRYLHLRPRNLSPKQICGAIATASRMVGRPYDFQYELDDEKIYCSELIYKAFLRGAGLEIGRKQKLREMNWAPYVYAIKAVTGGKLPLDRVMVTPESIAVDSDLVPASNRFNAMKRKPKSSKLRAVRTPGYCS